MAHEASPSVERLLSESVWLSSLARALLGNDDAAVDDVVQEARLAALQSAPADPEHARAWLARVTRNFALRVRLRRTRRERRERAAAVPEAQPSTLELVARVNAQRRVAAAVVALEEPYRSVVLLRWFDALSVRDVAARLGVPVETVRTRLKRALAKLREELDAGFGGREAWAGLLLPWTKTTGSAVAGAGAAAVVGAGVVTMSALTKSTIAAAFVVAAALAWQLLPGLAGSSTKDAGALRVAGGSIEAANATGSDASRETRRTEGVDATRSTESPDGKDPVASASPALEDFHVSAVVVSALDERPVAGAELRLTTVLFGEQEITRTVLGSARTDAEGRVEVQFPSGKSRFPSWEVVADGFVTGGGWNLDDERAVRGRIDLGMVKLERGLGVRGRVVRSSDSRPVAGAELRLDPWSSGTLESIDFALPFGTSAVDGSFTLRDRVARPTRDLRPLFALCDEGLGIGLIRAPAGTEEVENVEVIVGPTARLSVSIRDDAGAPIEGADVCCMPRFLPFSAPQMRDGLQQFATLHDPRLARLFTAKSGADGVATFERLPMAPTKPVLEVRDSIATRYAVAARRDDHEYGACDVRVDPSAPANCTVVLARTRHVSVVGKVVAPDGEPIPDAAVSAWAYPSRFVATTDERGEFRLDRLPTSGKSLQLEVAAAGRAKFQKGFEFASLELVPLLDGNGAPIEARKIDVVLERTVRISGRIVDEDGAPIRRAKVSYSPSRDGVLQLGPIDEEKPGSDDEGRFDHEVTESEWTVIAHAPLEDGTWGPGTLRAVKGGATGLVITCITRPARAAKVTCTVVDAATGAPVPVASADVVLAEGFLGSWNVWKRVGLGSVVARGLFAGRWRVDVRLADHRAASREFEVANDRDEVPLRIEVGMPARVVGRVELDPAGAKASKRKSWLCWDPSDVRLVDADDRVLTAALPASAQLGDDGRFILDGFVPGRIARVFFTDFDGSFDEVVFTPAPDEEREVVLRPAPAAKLALKSGVDVSMGFLNVDLATGDEPWHREIWLLHRDAAQVEPVHTIRPGHYRWRAYFHPDSVSDEPPHVTTASGEFDVAAGATHELRIDELR